LRGALHAIPYFIPPPTYPVQIGIGNGRQAPEKLTAKIGFTM
jgi:hypothetical protein